MTGDLPTCPTAAVPGDDRGGWPLASPTRVRRRVACGLVAVVWSGAFAAFYLHTGWYPHDEGQLGQTALRILDGELPHRDFDEMYTGGLSYLHALAFQRCGVSSESTRLVLWLFFLPFVAVWYWLASRVIAPWPAAAASCLAAATTLPIYPGSVPSWYNLFFAIFGGACLLKSLRGRVTLWLMAAGLCAGCSILFKVTGIYLVAAGALFLIYREQSEACGQQASSWLFSVIVTASLAGFALMSLSFCRAGDRAMSAIHFSAPLVAIAALLIWREWTVASDTFVGRWRRSVRLQFPFGLGVTVPIALLVLFYDLHDALPELYQGVLVAPRLRLSGAHALLPPMTELCGAIPLGLIILLGLGPTTRLRTIWMCGLSVVVVVLTWKATIFGHGTAGIISTLRNSTPFILGGSLLILARRSPPRRGDAQDAELFLMVVLAATSGLIQFPFSTATYFFYSAATLLMCLVYAYRRRQSLDLASAPLMVRCWSWLLVALLMFALVRLPSFESRFSDGRLFPVAALQLPRCHLRIPVPWIPGYQDLVRVIRERSRDGENIYAFPDFPEAYFLAERRNPTGWMYDFYRPQHSTDASYLRNDWERNDVKVAAVKLQPPFSPMDSSVLTELSALFPGMTSVYVDLDLDGERETEAFRVYWRD